MQNKISLKAARVNAKLTMSEAAKSLNIGIASLANYESGKTAPNVVVLQKMEKLYNTPYSDMDFSCFKNRV